MYFLFDNFDRKIEAFQTRGEASRAFLAKICIDVPAGTDPVKLAYEHKSDDITILSLSGAFDSIAITEDDEARALASMFRTAVDNFYSKK